MPAINHSSKIVITGAAGLVGQNLVLELCAQGYKHIIAIDKHVENLSTLQRLNEGIETVYADIAEPGDWQQFLVDADCVVMLHAQITGLYPDEFVRNNVSATQHCIDAIKQSKQSPFTVHISSSVVVSVADDDYTRTKKAQELLFLESGLQGCVLRPTLMFGWFDPKHLGWLSRFMAKIPVFPIPGDGRYLRQPLYCRDFCRIIIAAMQQQPNGKVYDIVGQEHIDYIDMIRLIKKVKKLKTLIVRLPYQLFKGLMTAFAMVNKNPPFTVSQLKALTAGDHFTGIDFEKEFAVKPTPLHQAFQEAFTDSNYSEVLIKRS